MWAWSVSAAIPQHVPALGVEIDSALAEQARILTGRTVIAGDFFDTVLPERPTVVLGNPPFETRLVERLLDRSHSFLSEGERVLLILPAYFFQTAGRVARYSERWSMAQEMIPRNLYPGLKYPLVFSTFTKDQKKLMMGMRLYQELSYLQLLSKDARACLDSGPAAWSMLVLGAIDDLGGVAALLDIYEYVADRQSYC